MRRPSLSSLIVLAVTLGVGSGALEVGLRASPQHGMGPGAIAALLVVSIGLATAYLVVAALIGWATRQRPYGMLIGALVLVHGALWYRFDLVLNRFATDPRVWGGMLGILLVAAGLAVVLDAVVERGRVVVALLALIVGAFGTSLAVTRSAAVVGQPRNNRKNVLIITVDTLRADHIAPYGADNATPNFSALAKQGALFETVVASAPVTEPSHLAIMTGQPPYQSGVAANGTRLGDRPALVWRAFHDAGYTTGAFVSGFPLHSRFGWSQGMDVYDDDFGSFQGLHSLSLVKAWDQIFLPAHTLRERRGDLTVKRALAFLGQHDDDAFFMWVHLFDPHGPYEAPGYPFDPPTDGAPLDLPRYWPAADRAITSTDWLKGAYDAEIRYSDGLVGQLIDGLRFHNLLDDTVVVLTADHGESLTEHDYLFDHGDHLYDASLMVPLIVRAPGLARPGYRVPCQVSNEDVAPTLLAMLGLTHAPGQDAILRAGRDLSGMAAGGACDDRAIVSSTVSVRFVDQPPVDHIPRAGSQADPQGQGRQPDLLRSGR
ncbi:MAG: sulfatase [Oligoflexia bacterium]|nr:sulfatase [Oligoflexia bacterium]